jgi:hypothetical protein
MPSIARRAAAVVVPFAVPFAFAACSGMGPTTAAPGSGAPDVPAAIAAPTGNKLAMTLKGSGLQNYECRAKTGGGGYDWAFVGPEAALRDKSDALVGRHYGGPTWEYGDGSKVTGKVVADVPSPNPGNIPWLLLSGTSTAQDGALRGTTYIQRVNTSGGVAPAEPCTASTAGQKKGVRYTADYVFYRG